MKTQPATFPVESRLGDFDSLLAQLDRPSHDATIAGGYTQLLSRLGAVDFRRRYGRS